MNDFVVSLKMHNVLYTYIAFIHYPEHKITDKYKRNYMSKYDILLMQRILWNCTTLEWLHIVSWIEFPSSLYYQLLLRKK